MKAHQLNIYTRLALWEVPSHKYYSVAHAVAEAPE